MARILVADDNSNIQKMVGLALKDQGIDVVAVGNGEAAVRKISELKPDLVLADIFMPVRNGYEVCSYVKEDPSLAHIPVILLVGAFDPLDEQEAQRVGADGVLKKPFVPPDPLISMVKSALLRAGIAIGKAAAEKAPEPPPAPRPPVEAARPAIVAKAPQPLTPVLAEESFVDEMPDVPAAVKIAAGQQPVAFGSLLETGSSDKLLTEEDDAQFISKPMPEMVEERKWGSEAEEESDEVEEEEESHGGWRPGGLDAMENIPEPPVAAVPDWREQAFHGNSPANGASSKRWAPAGEIAPAEAARTISVMEKPAETVTPFSGDAWAAAMASGLEHKLADVNETQMDVVAQQSSETPAVNGTESARPTIEPPSWFSSSSTQWESEAKKASELAATWAVTAPEAQKSEAPAQESLVAESQPAYSQTPEIHAVESGAVEAAPADSSIDSSSLRDAALSADSAVHSNSPQQSGQTSEGEISHLQAIPELAGAESAAHEIAEGRAVEGKDANWGSAWNPKPAGTPDSPETDQQTAQAQSVHANQKAASTYRETEIPAHQEPESSPSEIVDTQESETASFVSGVTEIRPDDPVPVAQTSSFYAHVPEAVAEAAKESGALPQATDMDELVARVLAKMNPDVLQRVTREILRPVIEAIVQDEINSKKS